MHRCGGPTNKGSPCNNPVANEGVRCRLHPQTSSQNFVEVPVAVAPVEVVATSVDVAPVEAAVAPAEVVATSVDVAPVEAAVAPVEDSAPLVCGRPTKKNTLCKQPVKHHGDTCRYHVNTPNTPLISNSSTTTQLTNGKLAENLVHADLLKQGYTDIVKVESQQNRKLRTNADFFALKDGQKYSISVKTDNGQFTSANLGPGISSQYYILLKENNKTHEMLKISAAADENRARRLKLLANYSRWEDVPNQNEVKFAICQPFLECYQEHLNNIDNMQLWVNYLIGRQSDLLAVVNLSTSSILYHTKRTTRQHIVVRDFNIHLKDSSEHSKTLVVLINNDLEFSMRFKTEGGTVKSSVKINLEHPSFFL